jgi:hypothetical protein
VALAKAQESIEILDNRFIVLSLFPLKFQGVIPNCIAHTKNGAQAVRDG